MWNSGYMKFIIALGQVLVAGLIVVTDPLNEGGVAVTPGESVWLATSVLQAVLVVVVPNLDGGVAKYTKVVVNGALAVLAIVLSLLLDGFQANDALLMLMAFLTGAGIWTAPAPQHQRKDYALAA